MFSKEEEKAIRTEFWDTLLKKSRAHKSASGKKVNWMKYPTGMKDVYLRAEADKDGCRVCIDFQFRDAGIRELFMEQFLETKTVFENTMETQVHWLPHYTHSYKTEVARVMVENTSTNMFKKQDWEEMHEFILTHLRRADTYWIEFNELFFTLLK